jgi:hypothetical protein
LSLDRASIAKQIEGPKAPMDIEGGCQWRPDVNNVCHHWKTVLDKTRTCIVSGFQCLTHPPKHCLIYSEIIHPINCHVFWSCCAAVTEHVKINRPQHYRYEMYPMTKGSKGSQKISICHCHPLSWPICPTMVRSSALIVLWQIWLL